MFSNVTVALLFGVGFAAWIYSKIYRSSGGNNQTALIVAGGSGLLLFLLIWIALGIIFD